MKQYDVASEWKDGTNNFNRLNVDFRVKTEKGEEKKMSKLKVVHIKDVKGERREPPRTSWILCSEKMTGSQNLSMGVNETYPGGMIPEHRHENEEEVMFFLSGRGRFITPDEEFDLEPGMCVYNPPGGLHKIINTGDEVLRLVWIYSPQLTGHRKA
jgi:mannose-6-phosphate isomerase-like protein (cupin superfamily)